MEPSSQYYSSESFGAPPIRHSSQAADIISLLNISAILALVIGILEIIWGFVELALVISLRLIFAVVGPAVIVALGILAIFVYINVNNLKRMMEGGRYAEVKDKIIIWMVLGFIACWIIVGILLLIAYLKLDELARSHYYPYQPPPPPQPYYPPPSIPPHQIDEYSPPPPPQNP